MHLTWQRAHSTRLSIAIGWKIFENNRNRHCRIRRARIQRMSSHIVTLRLETYISVMHPCQSHGRVCTQQADVAQISEKLDPCKYAREGHSTTDALIYILRVIHKATYSGKGGARMFFADYSKGFDLIDNSILLRELAFFIIDTV